MNIFPEVLVESGLPFMKPPNQHHFGGLQNGFDTARAMGTLDRQDHDLFVNWISEGATCGGTAAQCAQ